MSGRVRRLAPLAIVAVAAALAAVSASVFVYYPVDVGLTYQEPPIILEAGSNAGGKDLGGNTITVNIGVNKTSAQIELHPTYQRTLYHGVLNITHTGIDSQTYYVIVRVDDYELNVTGNVKLIIYRSDGTVVGTIDTASSQLKTNWITIAPGETLGVDIEFRIDEGQKISGVTGALNISVIYSPQNVETPP